MGSRGAHEGIRGVRVERRQGPLESTPCSASTCSLLAPSSFRPVMASSRRRSISISAENFIKEKLVGQNPAPAAAVNPKAGSGGHRLFLLVPIRESLHPGGARPLVQAARVARSPRLSSLRGWSPWRLCSLKAAVALTPHARLKTNMGTPRDTLKNRPRANHVPSCASETEAYFLVMTEVSSLLPR